MDNPPVDRDAELDNEICRIPEDKDGNGKEKSSAEDTNKATSNENNEPNGVLGKNFVDIHTEADQSELKSRAERSMELGENADGRDSILGQEISMGANQMCRNLCEQELRSGKRKNTSNKSAKFGLDNGVDHDDDNPLEKLLHISHVDMMTIIDRQNTQPEYGHDKGREVNASHAFQKEPNNEQNHVLDKSFVDIHAEVDQSKFNSRAERSMELGENADGDEPISGQGISMGENQMCRSLCEQESRSGNGKNASIESAKSGLGDGVVTPDHVDDNPPEKLLHVPHVDKITTTDTDQEVNVGHAFQEEPNSSRGDVSRKAMAIDTSGDRSRKRKLKKKEADGNNTDLDKKRCNHIEDNGPSGSRRHDENGGAGVSEYKSRQSTGPNRREILTHITRENSSNSTMPRNSREKPRKRSRNRQRTYGDVYEQHPATDEQRYEHYPSNDVYEQHPATDEQRYERYPSNDVYEQHPATDEQRYGRYPSNYNYDWRSHDPLRPVFAPNDFDANGCYDPYLYLREAEHDIPGWHSPRFHHGNHEYFTSGRHSPPYFPARPEDVDYSRNVNNLPFRGYDERGNFMHGEYRAMGFDPAPVYSPRQVSNNGTYQPHPGASVEGCGAGYGERYREYGGSNYTFASGPRHPAAGSVTDRYAPRLEQTNNRPRR